MGRIKRGNYIFVTWIGDHGHHVHVWKDSDLILKWDIDTEQIISGKINRKLLKILRDLKKEGRI